MDTVGKIWSEKKMFIAFDQMKDEPVKANALFNIPLVVWLVIVYVIWRKQADTVTASVNGMFTLQSLAWEEMLLIPMAPFPPNCGREHSETVTTIHSLLNPCEKFRLPLPWIETIIFREIYRQVQNFKSPYIFFLLSMLKLAE